MAEERAQSQLYLQRLDQMLDHTHPLYQLAPTIAWLEIENRLGPLYADGIGRPAIPTRMMVGLHLLKHLHDESDETVVYKFAENPYWQHFCGLTHFTHALPCDPSQMTRWRQRAGVEGVELLLKATIDTARRAGFLKEKDLQRVTVDTTVQEKAVAYPTDSRLYDKARKALVREARRCGIAVKQSYHRKARSLRRRIAGSGGHLSNRAAAELLGELHHPGLGVVVLAHLSRQCNTEAEARATVASALRRAGFAGALHVAEQDVPLPPIPVEAVPRVQLGLAL